MLHSANILQSQVFIILRQIRTLLKFVAVRSCNSADAASTHCCNWQPSTNLTWDDIQTVSLIITGRDQVPVVLRRPLSRSVLHTAKNGHQQGKGTITGLRQLCCARVYISSCWFVAHARVNEERIPRVRRHNLVYFGDKCRRAHPVLISPKIKLWDLTKTLLQVGDTTKINIFNCYI